MLALILIAVALMLCGASIGKPIGWVVLGLGVVVLLLAVGGPHIHIG